MLLRGRVYRVHACGSDTVVVERDMIWVIKVVVMKVRLRKGSSNGDVGLVRGRGVEVQSNLLPVCGIVQTVLDGGMRGGLCVMHDNIVHGFRFVNFRDHCVLFDDDGNLGDSSHVSFA